MKSHGDMKFRYLVYSLVASLVVSVVLSGIVVARAPKTPHDDYRENRKQDRKRCLDFGGVPVYMDRESRYSSGCVFPPKEQK